jgi:hypothetical protein
MSSSFLDVGCHHWVSNRPNKITDSLRFEGMLHDVHQAAWVPLRSLTTDSHLAPLGWSAIHPGANVDAATGEPVTSMWDGLPSVVLPVDPCKMVASPAAVTRQGAGSSVERLVARFRLWGLTLGIVNNILTSTSLREVAIDYHSVEKAVSARNKRGPADADGIGVLTRARL